MFETLLFVGGYDDTITPNKNVGISDGFTGCIKDVSVRLLFLCLLELILDIAHTILTIHNYSKYIIRILGNW